MLEPQRPESARCASCAACAKRRSRRTASSGSRRRTSATATCAWSSQGKTDDFDPGDTDEALLVEGYATVTPLLGIVAAPLKGAAAAVDNAWRQRSAHGTEAGFVTARTLRRVPRRSGDEP